LPALTEALVDPRGIDQRDGAGRGWIGNERRKLPWQPALASPPAHGASRKRRSAGQWRCWLSGIPLPPAAVFG